MRYKIVLFLIITWNQLYSQHSFQSFFNPEKNFYSFIETYNNELAFFMDDSLFIFNQVGEILDNRYMHDENHWLKNIFKCCENEYISLGIYDYIEEEHFNFWIKKYDSEFNPIWEKTHLIDLNGKILYGSWDCILNSNNELIVVTNIDSLLFVPPPSKTHIYKFSENGDLITSENLEDYQDLLMCRIEQIPDTSGYLMGCYNIFDGSVFNGTNNIFRLNNNFDVDSAFMPYLTDNIIYEEYPNIKFIDKERFLFAGGYYDHLPGSSQNLGISLYDTSYTELKYTILGSNDFDNRIASLKGLDFTDTSAIFTAYSEPDITYFPPTELNYTVIAKLNSNLDVVWEQFYGDSLTMSMTTIYVHATNDGGCIVTGHIQFAPFDDWKVQTYILKLDAEGNLPVSVVDIEIKTHELFVYPNPGIGHLNIRTAVQSLGGEFNLYDINGKLLYKQTITDRYTEINTNKLSKGTYIYSYVYKDKEVETGKWIKNAL